MADSITSSTYTFIKEYTDMDIQGISIHCPYWMNKLALGVVVKRGFLNGKGTAKEIHTELLRRLTDQKISREVLSPEYIRKFAKRENIGIDCSGLCYRMLNYLVQLRYSNTGVKELEEEFSGGINKTNADTLTSTQYTVEVSNISELRLGDLIRMRGGKHILFIVEVTDKEIIYAHSSSQYTLLQGAHFGTIRITDTSKPLNQQVWTETTKEGKSFGVHYNPSNGDGVYRLKIFA